MEIERLREENARLRALIEVIRPKLHYHCDDSWYCCGACNHPDHGGELLPEHRNRAYGVCDCGLDDLNKTIEKELEQLK